MRFASLASGTDASHGRNGNVHTSEIYRYFEEEPCLALVSS
jgi:hypothetical protein